MSRKYYEFENVYTYKKLPIRFEHYLNVMASMKASAQRVDQLILGLLICLTIAATVKAAAIEASISEQNTRSFIKDLTRFARLRSKRSPEEMVAESTDAGSWSEEGEVKTDLLGRVSREVITTRMHAFRRNGAGGHDRTVKCGNCELRLRQVAVKKPTCRVRKVVISTCAGMCETFEIPEMNGLTKKHHTVCRPSQVEYVSVKLQGCARGVYPFVTLSKATACKCQKCSSKDTSCRSLY